MSRESKKSTPIRTAYDFRKKGSSFEVVAVDYADGMSEERVLYKNESDAMAAAQFNAYTKAAAYEVMTGMPVKAPAAK